MGKTRLQTAGGAAAGVAGDAAGAPTVSGAAGFTRLGVAGGSLATAAQATLYATPAGFPAPRQRWLLLELGTPSINRSEGEGVVH